MADAVEIVAARAAFLAAGHYAPLERALAGAGAQAVPAHRPGPPAGAPRKRERHLAATTCLSLFLIGTLGYTPLEIGLRVLPLSVGAMIAR